MNNLLANWPAPSNIGALTTTRAQGHSAPPFDKNNLGLHVGDIETDVLCNRRALSETLALPGEPIWLEQTHSNDVAVIEEHSNQPLRVDAAITRKKQCPLTIMTADCLPILLCDEAGTEIAAIHAGWRGLANGIVENTVAKMDTSPHTMMAWIGPAICGNCYEVGAEVEEAYLKQYPFAHVAFRPHGEKRYVNLAKIAELVLNSCGIKAVYQSAACTFELKNQFYSYRREPQTGRMATLIWFKY